MSRTFLGPDWLSQKAVNISKHIHFVLETGNEKGLNFPMPLAAGLSPTLDMLAPQAVSFLEM